MLNDEDELSYYAKRRCPSCPHGLVIHRRSGGCSAGGCMCGWERRGNGELFEKSTGLSAAEVVLSGGRKRKGKISKAVRPELMRIPCYFCGGAPENIDHLLPLSRGGTNYRTNLVSSCKVCNNLKSDRNYDEFIAYCKETVESLPFILRTPPTKHQIRAEHCRKILTWHEARLKSKSVPVV